MVQAKQLLLETMVNPLSAVLSIPLLFITQELFSFSRTGVGIITTQHFRQAYSITLVLSMIRSVVPFSTLLATPHGLQDLSSPIRN